MPAGSHGVIFTPWLHGHRWPFEDPSAAGVFFNVKIETGKRDMIRSVLEGICFHLRWMLECEASKVRTSDTVRFVGGGALSKITCQILADITGRTIETVTGAQDVGAVGAALLVAVGTGVMPYRDAAKDLITVKEVVRPNPANREVYDRNYAVFKKLYKCNASNFKALNEK